MSQPVDEHFVENVRGFAPSGSAADDTVDTATLEAYFTAQAEARHLDFAARWMQSQGFGYYTIGSAGHESNAGVALALRPTDPALLHYRSGGFYAARAGQVDGADAVRDVVHSLAASTDDPISGGRHKVFGNKRLSVIPQTSTIGSHLPRAVGLAYSLERAEKTGVEHEWPSDSVVVCSFGDASLNHSTAVGALNTAAYCAHAGLRLPLLLVCEDNGIGISTRTPGGWVRRKLSSLPAVEYVRADGTRPDEVLEEASRLAALVREERRPAVLHLRTVRFMGHAGSDAELAYRTRAEIEKDYARDPLLATARALVDRGVMTPDEVLERYEQVRTAVMDEAAAMAEVKRLDSPHHVTAPLSVERPDAAREAASRAATDRESTFRGKLPEDQAELTLAQTINVTLHDVLAAHDNAQVFGEDVAFKGGVYGVTRGLRKTFGKDRVWDTLLDEQTILGTALGAALAGMLPIPEIQYLAYLHNAEDQLRGEAASLRFFSDGQYENGMVVRIQGLAYQKGFGGHFHNDNSVAVLRDIPGLVLVVLAHPADAPALIRACVGMAAAEGRVCVVLEPIARYHTRDLHGPDDGGWLATYTPPGDEQDVIGEVATYGDGGDLLVVTFGNGVFMSRRVAAQLADEGVDATVLDLRWLAPLPEQALLRHAERFDRVLVVDETRRSGGVSEAVLAALVDGGYTGAVRRVTSVDSFVPLGPAAEEVLLTEDQILAAARDLTGPTNPRS